MSNKKTIQKRQNRIKKRQKQILKFQNLKLNAKELEKKIAEQKKENFKQLNIRNLKIFKNTCNFLAPFVLTTGITVGAFAALGGGLPFHLDQVVKNKTYSLEYQTNGYAVMNESYRNKFEDMWSDEEIPESELIIYTPWELKDGQYIRYKLEYNIDKLNTLDLYNAVLNEDYQYIEKNLKEYKEEIQISNKIEEFEENTYFFDANLYFEDKSDSIKYNETYLKNIIITIVELIVGIGSGAFIAWIRDFNYRYQLSSAINGYKRGIKDIRPMEEELKNTNQKILSLSKRLGGKFNEK